MINSSKTSEEIIDYCRNSKFLIPGGGTYNWIKICRDNNYAHNGYMPTIITEIPISFDSRITVEDHSQIIGYGQNKHLRDFFTSVIFYKKELNNNSIYAPHEYERSCCVFYPYGTRFDESMLYQIGTALNKLINEARFLSDSSENNQKLDIIRKKQQKLQELFVIGTKDKDAVNKIMAFPLLVCTAPTTEELKEARYDKDYLPYGRHVLFESESTPGTDENTLLQ